MYDAEIFQIFQQLWSETIAAQDCRICSTTVLKFLLTRYSLCLYEKDEQGCLPLHIALNNIPYRDDEKERYMPYKKQVSFESLLMVANGSALMEKDPITGL